jgi:putative transposase
LGRTDDERRATYQQLFLAQVTKTDVEVIREATNKAWALGNDRFRQKVEALVG